MNTILKILLLVCKLTAITTISMLIISIGVYLIECGIIPLRFKFAEFIYYMGLGILITLTSHSVCDSVDNIGKDKK